MATKSLLNRVSAQVTTVLNISTVHEKPISVIPNTKDSYIKWQNQITASKIRRTDKITYLKCLREFLACSKKYIVVELVEEMEGFELLRKGVMEKDDNGYLRNEDGLFKITRRNAIKSKEFLIEESMFKKLTLGKDKKTLTVSGLAVKVMPFFDKCNYEDSDIPYYENMNYFSLEPIIAATSDTLDELDKEIAALEQYKAKI